MKRDGGKQAFKEKKSIPVLYIFTRSRFSIKREWCCVEKEGIKDFLLKKDKKRIFVLQGPRHPHIFKLLTPFLFLCFISLDRSRSVPGDPFVVGVLSHKYSIISENKEDEIFYSN